MAGRIEFGSFKLEWGKSKFTQPQGDGQTYDLKGTPVGSIYGSYDNFSEEAVSETRARGLATVFTCLNVRSRTIASLPINPMIEENGDKRVLVDHPLYMPLSHQANNYMTSANMFLTSMLHSDTNGNSVIAINRDSRGRVYSFDIVKPGDWDVTTNNGEAWYKLNGVIYPSRDVLHFRWFSMDGLCGISPITQNRITMGKAFKEERYSATQLGIKPPGFLHYEGNLSSPQMAQNQKSWKEDMQNGRTPVLAGRWDYKPIMLSADDAAYIETSKMTDQRIYGIFQLPPAFAQNYDRMTWSNSEQADLVYAKHTITPIVRVMEQEMNMKLFTEKEKKNHFVKFNMNGLLRGDSAARAAFYTAMRNIGGMNGNEIRDREDMNAYDGGETFTIQGANVPVDMLRDFYSNKVAPTAQPVNGKTVNGHYQNIN